MLRATQPDTLRRGEIPTRSVSEESGCEASLTLRVSVRTDRVGWVFGSSGRSARSVQPMPQRGRNNSGKELKQTEALKGNAVKDILPEKLGFPGKPIKEEPTFVGPTMQTIQSKRNRLSGFEANDRRSAGSRPRRPRPRHSAGVTNGESLLALHKWFLADRGIFAHLRFHGNTRWSPLGLASLALCWAWSDSRNLTDAFTQAVECCQTILGSSPLNSYQGFMAAMVRWTSPFVEILWLRLHQKMEEIGGKFWHRGAGCPSP